MVLSYDGGNTTRASKRVMLCHDVSISSATVRPSILREVSKHYIEASLYLDIQSAAAYAAVVKPGMVKTTVKPEPAILFCGFRWIDWVLISHNM